ncbi:Histone H4, partial [Quillaja saponaria]
AEQSKSTQFPSPFTPNRQLQPPTLETSIKPENPETKSTTKTIQSPSLPLKGIHNIHSSDGLPPCMLSVGDSITDNILQEDLEDTTSLFIDETTNSLNATSSRQTTNCRLCNALNVITEHLPVPLGSSLSQTL